MSKWKCPFCGSKNMIIETPYIDPITKKRETTYCCKEQRQNNQFIERRYRADDDMKPTPEEISVWKK